MATPSDESCDCGGKVGHIENCKTWSGWEQHVTSDGFIYYTYDGEDATVPYKLSTMQQVLRGTENMTPREYRDAIAAPAVDLKPAAPTHTSAKPPMHALPLDRLGGLARALDYGDNKYKTRNWVDTAKDPRLYIGAILRHLSAIQRGEQIDPESGLPHVNHLQASAVILEEALRNAGLLTTEYTK